MLCVKTKIVHTTILACTAFHIFYYASAKLDLFETDGMMGKGSILNEKISDLHILF